MPTKKGYKQKPEWIAKRIASRLATLRIKGFPKNTAKNITNEERENRSERMKAMWKNPAWKAKAIAASRAPRGPMPEYRRKQVSECFKGKKQSPGLIEKRASALRGRKLSPELCRKIGDARRGKKMSTEAKRRMSEAQRGRRHSESTKAKISAGNTGKTLSLSTRSKIRLASIGRIPSKETRAKLSAAVKSRNWSGERHPNWKGGITKEHTQIRNSDEIKSWKKSIFGRDRYTCQICFEKSGKLNAHHILPFAKFKLFRSELWNGRTLCHSCHCAVHREARTEQKASRGARSFPTLI